jgi:DNA-directed RNA polymerase subunit M/transcription elongation factor TFIIS
VACNCGQKILRGAMVEHKKDPKFAAAHTAALEAENKRLKEELKESKKRKELATKAAKSKSRFTKKGKKSAGGECGWCGKETSIFDRYVTRAGTSKKIPVHMECLNVWRKKESFDANFDEDSGDEGNGDAAYARELAELEASNPEEAEKLKDFIAPEGEEESSDDDDETCEADPERAAGVERIGCPKCYQNLQSFTSKTTKNPGRKFWKHPRNPVTGKDSLCTKFIWDDEFSKSFKHR